METVPNRRHCFRNIPSTKRTLYLSFDDGPHGAPTHKLLDVLKEFEVPSTFFVIGNRAFENKELLERMQREGHEVGDHSNDHLYRHYFSSDLRPWVETSYRQLTELLGRAPIGFRAPAGIHTPPLHRALRELNIPLIRWNVRFYDTQFRWTHKRALSSLEKTAPGSIILLHDPKTLSEMEQFLKTLTSYVTKARQLGFSFSSIPKLPGYFTN